MIRFATLEDTEKLMKFVSVNWRAEHILARDKKFFCYFLKDGENLNRVISENDGVIDAVIGFIPYGRKHRDIINCMWKANHDSGDPAIGLKLLNYLMKNADIRIMSSPNINPQTIPIYQYLGIHTGKMKHWYRLNPNVNYKIAVIKNFDIPPVKNSSMHFKEFSTMDELTTSMDMKKYKASNPKPYKENWFIRHRYFDHPIYKYYCFGVAQKDNSVNAVFFYRVQECNGSQVVRLVDCIGDFNDFAQIGTILDELLKRYNAEFVEIYAAGLDDELFKQAGLTDAETTNNIIPHYFTPYAARNIEIYYFSTDPKTVLFNGDGDTDRPS